MIRKFVDCLWTEERKDQSHRWGIVYVCRGEMVGIVGESGCGKSVTSQSIMRLYDEKEEVSYSGTVRFEGENLMEIPYKEMDKIRGNRIAMIFQDALSSLNPVYTVGNQVVEAICIHQNVEKKEA